MHTQDIGAQKGKYYSVNFPLRDGIDDESYENIFKPIIQKVMDWYRPGAVVLQCGADSLSGDRLGCFNLSLKGHGACVEFVQSFGLPLLVLGGGGYTIRNVARCWTYETALLLKKDINDGTTPLLLAPLRAAATHGAQPHAPSFPELPFNDYLEYYGPDFRLHLSPSNMENLNDPKYLEKTKIKLIENLRSVQVST